MQDQKLIEQCVSSSSVFQGRLLRVYRDEITLGDGSASVREYIRHSGAVCVLALTEDRRVPLVKQYRYPVGRVLLELPAGKLGNPKETPEAAACRELKEETGAVADRLVYLGPLLPTPAYTDEVIHLYFAEGVRLEDASPDDGELLTCELMPFDTLLEEVMAGHIADAKTQAAVLRVYARLMRS
ncbi:MAG: NUDIX hydrolase [Ruminococcaceae bacterium]|nr:NUDIX hydrolase [Oscillospiraceae bacterium]